MQVVFEELWFIAVLLITAFIIAAFAGIAPHFLILAFALYATWNIFWLYKTIRWLKDESQLPDLKPWGAWGMLLDELVPRVVDNSDGTELVNRRAALLTKIIEDLPIGVVVLNEDFIITSTNQAAVDLLGINLNRDTGYSIIKILRQPDLVQFLRSVKNGDNQRSSIEFSPRHNSRLILFLEVIKLEDMGYLMTIYDITEQRQIDTMRRDFIANISHEIRTPLSVIQGQSELLAESVDADDPMVDKAVNAIENQVGRLTGLSDDLIRLMELESNKGSEQEESVDLKSVINTLFAQLRGTYPVDTTFNIEDVDTVKIKMRHSDLVSVLENLITNSARYVHEPAVITVKTIRFQNGDLRVEFSDNGDGIATEHLSRLTERFYRVDAARSREDGGTGLGLSIVKHAMQSVGGSISIHSKLGKGTTVSLFFPSSVVDWPN